MNIRNTRHLAPADARRLWLLVENSRRTNDIEQDPLAALEDLLDAAIVLDGERIEPDRVGLRATVELEDRAGGAGECLRLVLPGERLVPGAARDISVLSPMGLALLGLRRGDFARVELPDGGRRELRIRSVESDRVESQPA